MGAMANLTNSALGLANAGAGMYQSQQQASAQRAQAELEAKGLEHQAARKDLEAAETLKIGKLKTTEQQIAGRLEIASQRVAYAASGVKANEGTPVEAMADKAAWNEYERQKIEYEYRLQSWGLKYDAALLRGQAANTRASGTASGSSYLSSLSTGQNGMVNLFKENGFLGTLKS